MQAVFREADADGNGVLDVKEFKECIRGLDLDLSDAEINQLRRIADYNDDGEIDYEEFVNFGYDELHRIRRNRYLSNHFEAYVLGQGGAGWGGLECCPRSDGA